VRKPRKMPSATPINEKGVTLSTSRGTPRRCSTVTTVAITVASATRGQTLVRIESRNENRTVESLIC